MVYSEMLLVIKNAYNYTSYCHMSDNATEVQKCQYANQHEICECMSVE